MDLYGYGEIRTPIFEDTAVFARGIGEETDIVGKEMYSFTDKGGASITLRPEMTAPVIRAYIQHGMGEQGLLDKLWYMGPMFRQERPQAGRYRQFHQFGFECIGQSNPDCDAEIIAMAAEVYRRLDITCTLKVNSVGDSLCRPVYRQVLREYLAGVAEQLSPDSLRRMNTNPMRVLDSKDPADRSATTAAPVMSDFLCDACREHFNAVLSKLRMLDIDFCVDPTLVRGLDYYTRTAFEFVSTDLGSQDALGGGGRYDGLVEQFGGKSTPAVGFASGMERVLIVMEKNGYAFPEMSPDVYIIALDAESRSWAFKTAIMLRTAGLRVELDYAGRSMKAQLREANRMKAVRVVIVGEKEMAEEKAIVKRMEDGMQTEVSFEELHSALSRQP